MQYGGQLKRCGNCGVWRSENYPCWRCLKAYEDTNPKFESTGSQTCNKAQGQKEV